MSDYVPFELPDDECERLTRSEMKDVRMIFALSSELMYAREDLKKRMEQVPDGYERLVRVSDDILHLFQDILGTVCDRQRKQLQNAAKDMHFTLIPKFDLSGNKLMISLAEMRELTNCAREKCLNCVEDGQQAKKCRLYKWLETNVPLDDYGDDLLCPYATIDWGD